MKVGWNVKKIAKKLHAQTNKLDYEALLLML
jgi:hypothetical protein